MRTTYIRLITLAEIILLLLLVACSNHEEYETLPLPADNYLQIEGEIVGADIAASRATTESLLTMSYLSFDGGDKIGFFSFHDPGCDKGHLQPSHQNNDDTEYLRNEKLTYSNATGSYKFVSDGIKDIVLSTLGLTFAYYPYSEETVPNGYKKYDAKNKNYVDLGENEHYVGIFVEEGDGKGKVERNIEDILTAAKRQYADVNYRFEHRFAMLLLFLGEGFTDENNPQLKVHLTERILGAHVLRRWKSASVTPDELTLIVDKVPAEMTGFDHIGSSVFIAPKIEEYTLPEDPSNRKRTVYPIILPDGVEIDYIELLDQSGMPQTVKPTPEALPGLESGWKYPMTIKMTGITPTIYPHEIVPWGEGKEIEVTRQAGIYNDTDFADWIEVYNRTLGVGTQPQEKDKEKLDRYGTLSDGRWTFYLRGNIDCKDILTREGTLIKSLPAGVMIDGGNYKVYNLLLDFETTSPPTDGQIGLIGTIEGGHLEDLRLDSVTVRNTHVDVPAGGIAARIESGEVVDCSLRGVKMLCREGGSTGALTGIMTGGNANRCKLHGTVVASEPQVEDETLRGVVGTKGEGGNITEVVNRIILLQ